MVHPVSVQRDDYVSQAVSHAVSTILPGSDTMTTLNETGPGELCGGALQMLSESY